jgi:uncharacterized membrane protein (UPF0127 family)
MLFFPADNGGLRNSKSRNTKVLLLSFCLLFSFFCPSAGSAASATGPGKDVPALPVRKMEIVRQAGPGNGRPVVLLRLAAEIATDRRAREKGLSGRESLAENRGMLFLLDRNRPGAFWMKGMKFPLDLLYFDSHRRLIGMLQELQPCDDCPQYLTPRAAAYVLEIPGGTAAKYGITKGARFLFTGAGTGRRAQ